MTPLAHRIVSEAVLPMKRRTFRDRCGLTDKLLDDIHCFEVSEVYDAGSADLMLGGSVSFNLHSSLSPPSVLIWL